MGGGLGGGSPPFKRYLMLDWSSKRGLAEDLLSRELCKSVARGAFPSIFDPTPKNNPHYSVLKLEYSDMAKKRLSKLVLRTEKDNTLALCTYLRWNFIMTRIWLSIRVACGGFVSLSSMVNPQPAEHSPLFLFNRPQNSLPIEICTYHHWPGEAPLGLSCNSKDWSGVGGRSLPHLGKFDFIVMAPITVPM